MGVPALVPHESEDLFRARGIPGVDPVYYRPGHESLSMRVARKIGLRDPRHMLEASLRVVNRAVLPGNAFALWLSPSLHVSSLFLEQLLDQLPALRWVYSQVTGTEHLDLEMFRERGIMVSNTGDLSSRRVAEMALACILAHAKRLPAHIAMQRERKWRSLPTGDLGRQTVGILGTGNIGRELASLCRGLDMRTIGASRNPDRFGRDPFPYHRLVSLHEELPSLLAEADHVVVALPLHPETEGLIGRNVLNGIKTGASLVNVSRGPIVDEIEMCRALSEGRIGAAFLDRPGGRLPPYPWSRLYRTRNLVLTHYSATHSPHRTKEAFEQFVSGLRQLMETGHPPNRVA